MNLLRPVRMAWRRLTSMRTALILLFLLAVAAVPGSLLPQRPLNPDSTDSYIAAHGGWGRFLDHIGAFDVFGSVWFAAIYLLLFASLVGCLIPRIKVHARALARKPLPAPRHLSRLPEAGTFETGTPREEFAAVARGVLGRRWRVERRVDADGVVTLSAEKGYSRETGNIVFHVALLAALLLIAVGRLYNYEGQVIVKQGTGVCNAVSNYDSWKPGRFAAQGKVHPAPFCIDKLTRFTARYTARGEATDFRAQIRYRENVTADSSSTARTATITVNHPLRLEGDRVYLLAHGFAPKVTIRMPDGSVRHDTEVFIPTDATTLLSEGVFSQDGKPGANQDIGIKGIFAPTPLDRGDGLITSLSPEVTVPVLSMFVFEGDTAGSGDPHSVYTLDTSKMRQIGKGNLQIGQSLTLRGGVSVTFDGWVPWASLQVSHDPAQNYLLIASVAMVVGLFGSLAVRRRRLWVRIGPGAAQDGSSPTVVTVGGLARSDSGNFPAEFAGVLSRLRAAGAPVPQETQQQMPATQQTQAKVDVIGAGKD